MANRLKMARVQSILSLRAQGWSRRRIARELGIDRETVSRYVELDQQSAATLESGDGVSKPANAPILSPGSPAFSPMIPQGVPFQQGALLYRVAGTKFLSFVSVGA